MRLVILDLSMSLDGFIAGPKSEESPDREIAAVDRLHDWMFAMEGDFEAATHERFDDGGAVIIGRRMFDLGYSHWGDNPPFGMPVFVLTHHAGEPLVKQGGTTYFFSTGGIEHTLAQARQAAGSKHILVLGGANIAQQLLAAGLIDELKLHVVPVLLGAGIRLFEQREAEPIDLEQISVVGAPGVIHLRLRVVQ